MGHKIEFDKKPFQGKLPTPINMIKFSDTAINLIQEEVSELLSKGAIKKSVIKMVNLFKICFW